jgi:polyhydroxybutyrate depolymerase
VPTALITVVLIILLLAGCESPGTFSYSEEASAPAPKPMLRRVLTHDNIEREYFVYLPPQASSGKPLPVVFALHGYTTTATGFAATHGSNRHASAHGYIAVYPQGSHFMVGKAGTDQYQITSWNDLAANIPHPTAGPHCAADSTRYPCPAECGACNRCAWTSCYDDIGFLEKVMDAVSEEFNTNEQRHYLLGVSNGGMMALRMGCAMPLRFAAVTSIIGQLAPGYDCSPEENLPLLHLVGGRDNSVRPDGAAGADGFMYTSAAITAKTWAAGIGCSDESQLWSNQVSRSAGLSCTSYSDCLQQTSEVVSCMDPQATHVWPGQGVAGVPATCITNEQKASMPTQPLCPPEDGEYTHWGMDLVWDFMSQHQR